MKETIAHKPRNFESHQKHRKETFWQIIFPTLIVALVLVGIAVWTGFAAYQGSDLRQAANTSMIFLILPVLIVSLVPFILLVGILFGAVWLNKNIPVYAKQVEDIAMLIQGWVHKYSDKFVEPLIRLQSYREIMRKIFGIRN